MADEAKAVDSIQSDIAETKVTNPLEGGVPNTDDLDKRIQSAVDKTASKIKKEYEAKLSNLETELANERKAKMTDAERIEAERKEFEEKSKALAERERKLTIIEALAGVGLPPDFANRISGTTEDEIRTDAKALKEFLDTRAHELSEAEIAKRLKGDTPKGGQKPSDKVMTRESFEKLDPQAKIDFMVAGGKLTD
jgi:DNA repair exonuclease SbcCD ATPase subunit